MKVLIAVLILGIVGIIFVEAQPTQCAGVVGNPTCTKCVAANNATNPCGWCAPLGMCLPGNRTGPFEIQCLGSAWEFNTCTNCAGLSTCHKCNEHTPDCFWCSSTNDCRPQGFVGCTRVGTCPCNQYTTCSECITNNLCSYCGDTLTCVPSSTTGNCSIAYTTSCPCGVFQDCGTCTQQDGCSWCDKPAKSESPSTPSDNVKIPGPGTGGCVPTALASCPIADNCNQFCSQAMDCGSCNTLEGCAWCGANFTCVDATTPNNCLLTHSCANCPQHSFCEPCLDEGCMWCPNGTSGGVCSALTANPPASCYSGLAGYCNEFCSAKKDCNSCMAAKGCGWCTDQNGLCVDIDQTMCAFAPSCSAPVPGPAGAKFDGGSFVGGMFLVIGVAALAAGGVFFYRWRTGKRGMYTELRG